MKIIKMSGDILFGFSCPWGEFLQAEAFCCLAIKFVAGIHDRIGSVQAEAVLGRARQPIGHPIQSIHPQPSPITLISSMETSTG